jgi:6-phosphogluconolactonase
MRDTSSWQAIIVTVATCLLLVQRGWAIPPTAPTADEMFVYIGTYAAENEDGIHICRFNLATGQIARIGAISGIKNPSFQALHPNGRFLYSVSEWSEYEGKRAGSVHAYAIDRSSGQLTHLNSQSSMGESPCHVTVDHAAGHVLAANYTGGSVVVLPIETDGGLGVASAFVQHKGSSVHPRQEAPHAHCMNVDPADRYVVAADLGTDQVVIYQYDRQSGLITPNPRMPAASVKPGAGPRHFAFHPQGKFGYVINELNSTVTAFTYDGQNGALKAMQDISTLPADFRGESTTAEIVVSPDGKFLYGSNRGHDSIAVFSIHEQTGQLTVVSHHSTLGKEPRNFAIDPTGTYLVAANQRTGNVVVFQIDRTSGKLAPTGHQIEIPTPVCVTFLAK